ncbi:MAG: hypothetical protein ABW217_18855 [Polyangiaceae bacterium]
MSSIRSSVVRAAWFWPLVATLIASLPCLFVGFSHDDLTHRLMLEGELPGFDWYALYDFTPPAAPASLQIERGSLPWFTNPEISLRFLRPVASATLALDDSLFGRAALPAHVHSLLWLALLVSLVALLYRRWFEAPAASVSAIVFALSGVHAMPTAWLASRHTLVAATFGVLALWGWIRFREQGSRLAAALALAALVLSLLSSESGLVAVALLVSFELGTRGWRSGARGAVLPLGVAVLYLAFYVLAGYGAHGSAFYVSPFSAPVAYAKAAVLGVPALVVELLLGLPSAVSGLGGSAALLSFAVLGLVAAAGAAALLHLPWTEIGAGSRRHLLWLALGSLVGLFALVGAPVTGRVLPLPLLGGAALVGHVLCALWQRARQRKSYWATLALLGLLHLALAPLVRLGVALEFRKSANALHRMALEADVGACAERGSLQLLTGADPVIALYTAPALRFHAPEKAGADFFRVLSMAPQAQQLTRTRETGFELAVMQRPRGGNIFEQLFRDADDPLRVGQRVLLPELAVSVSETSAGLFTRIHFEQLSSLEVSAVCFMVWRAGRLQALPMPAIGQSVRIEHEPGPMGL